MNKQHFWAVSDVDGYWDIIETEVGQTPPARIVHGYLDGPFTTKNQAKKAILAVWESAIRDLRQSKAHLKSLSASLIKVKKLEDFDDF